MEAITVSTVTAIVIAAFGSSGLFTFIQFLINRNSVTKKTLEALAYSQLSDKLEVRLDTGYATPEQRKEMEILIDAYKANGWNGDMDARISRFYALPTKKLD
jgi:hypothetical protein